MVSRGALLLVLVIVCRLADGFQLAPGRPASVRPVQAAQLAAARPVSSTGRSRPDCTMVDAQEIISAGVSLTTFAPQPFWLLMIVAPRSSVTRTIMGPIAPILGLSLAHFAIVVLAASQPDGTAPIAIFADVFDPAQSQLEGMRRLFEVPNFVAEEWPHVLICKLAALESL